MPYAPKEAIGVNTDSNYKLSVLAEYAFILICRLSSGFSLLEC
jgi:hypothetical protein